MSPSVLVLAGSRPGVRKKAPWGTALFYESYGKLEIVLR